MNAMNDEYAEQIGTPLEVYQRPETLYSTKFIFSPAIKLFDANIHSEQSRISVKIIGDVSMPKGKVTLGIRPEHLVPLLSGPWRSP